MKVSFRIADAVSKLPTVSDTTKPDWFSTKEKCYLLIGFNESVKETQKIKIWLDDYNPTDSYEILGMPNIFDEGPDIFSCILMELYVPITKNGKSVEYSEQGQSIVLYLDELREGKRYPIKLKNKDLDVLYTLMVVIESFSTRERFSPHSITNYWKELRDEYKNNLAQETQYFKEKAIGSASRFGAFGKGMERFDAFIDRSMYEERPLNSFLFFQLQATNEAYWINQFNYVMLIKKIELGLDNSVDGLELFSKFSLREKMTVYLDMTSAVSVNTPYLTDYILKPDGTLKKTDYFSSVDEGSGDCEDHAFFILYNTKMFQKCGKQKLKHKALRLLFEMSEKYECMMTVCCLTSPFTKQKEKICHMATLFLLKSWVLNHLLIKEEDGISKESLKALIDYEKDIGSYDIDHFDKDARLPVVLFGEGTAFVYPYQTDDYVIGNLDTKSDKLSINGIYRRLYQTPDFQFHLRYILLITNFFIDHPKSRVNLPTMYLSYRDRSKEGYLIKGVASDDLYMQNQLDSNEITLIPQGRLLNVNGAVEIMKLTSRDKFGLTPLFIQENTGKHIGRYAHVGKVVEFNSVPKSFKGYQYFIVNIVQYPKLMKRIPEKMVIGVKSVQLLAELTVCIVWIDK